MEAKKKRKRKWRWVTRFGRGDFVYIWKAARKPTDWGGGGFASLCAYEFHEMTGIRVNPGDCIKVQFSAKVVK